MSLANLVDHTYLGYDEEKVKQLCEEANEHDFAAVCVRGSRARLAKQLYSNVAVVMNFPEEKCYDPFRVEQDPFQTPADEIDVLINIRKILQGDTKGAIEDLLRVTEKGKLTKVILEADYLRYAGGESAILRAIEAAREANADFIKSSTGMKPRGHLGKARRQDVELMVKESGDMLVKASGGIETLEDMQMYVDIGASRLGMSKAAEILS